MQQPLLDLFNQAATAQSQVNTAPYTEQLYAPPNQTQQNAITSTVNAANLAGAGANSTIGLANDTINGKYLYADSNPYLKSAVNASIDPLRDNLLRVILPGLQDKSISQGAYGGSGYGVAQGLATSDFDKQALDIASTMYSNNYQQERQNQLNAPQLYNVANQLLSAPGQLLGQAGAQQQAWQQGQDTADLNLFQLNQQQPYAGLTTLAQILNGAAPYSSTSGTRTGDSTTGSNGTANFLQGISGVGALTNSLFPAALPAAGSWLASLFAAAPAAGSGIGAISSAAMDALPALVAALSDERLKRDIRTVGYDAKGRRWVTWQWLWDGEGAEPSTGVIAQEVAANDPQAVTVGPHGFLMVDYSKLAA